MNNSIDLEKFAKEHSSGTIPKGFAEVKPDSKIPEGNFECPICHEIKAHILGAIAWLPAAQKPTSQNKKPTLPTQTSVCDNCHNIQFFIIPNTEFIKT